MSTVKSKRLNVYEGWVCACHARILRGRVIGVITDLERQRYKEVEACAKCAKAKRRCCPVRADRRQPRWLRIEVYSNKPRRKRK